VTAVAGVQLLGPADFEAAAAGRVLINVHIPDEGSLPGTDLALPYNEIDARAADLPADKATPLAIYCMSGNMSAGTAATRVHRRRRTRRRNAGLAVLRTEPAARRELTCRLTAWATRPTRRSRRSADVGRGDYLTGRGRPTHPSRSGPHLLHPGQAFGGAPGPFDRGLGDRRQRQSLFADPPVPVVGKVDADLWHAPARGGCSG
jgi:hypothetical protein